MPQSTDRHGQDRRVGAGPRHRDGARCCCGHSDWDGVDRLIPGQRHQGSGPSTARSTPADGLTWTAGDVARSDLWFPPRKILLEDGARALLPLLVMSCGCFRFTPGRMIPTREDTGPAAGGLVAADPAGAAAYAVVAPFS